MNSSLVNYYVTNKNEFEGEAGHEKLLVGLKKYIEKIDNTNCKIVGIDVGSCIGDYIPNLNDICMEQNKKILCFEPNPVNILELEPKINQDNTLKLFKHCISNETKTTSFYNWKDNNGPLKFKSYSIHPIYNIDDYNDFYSFVKMQTDRLDRIRNKNGPDFMLNPHIHDLELYWEHLLFLLNLAFNLLYLEKLEENVKSIQLLKQKIETNQCNKYIYIPIVLYPDPLNIPKDGKIAHANGLLINIATNPPSWIRIEPQTPNYSQDLDLNKTFEQIVLDVTNTKRCIHLQLKETCPPQHITKDSNCMFWSLLTLYKICDLIIHDKDPIELEYVYNEQLLENLQEKMNDWKHYLVNTLIPACLDKYHFIWPIFNELFTKNDDIHKLNQIRSLVNLPAISWFFQEYEINNDVSDEKRKILESFEKMHGLKGGHKILLNYYKKYKKR